MKITLFSTQSYDKTYFNANNKVHTVQYFDAPLTEETAILAQDSEAVCVFVNDTLNTKVICTLAEIGVKLIALRCAGYNNVNLQAAKEYGLTVVRVPSYSPHAVAEHTLALILTLNRKTHKAYNRVRDGNFSLDRLMGFDIFGKTVGVIGIGKIGATFCRIMQGMGCKVLAHDIIQNDELLKTGIEYTDLPNLLQSSDIISLHCPLNQQTHHIINSQSLALM
ncbi:MAG TPA: NAD(P)-dependent oxidoreductase, partial [Candidatus Kapabacteria bacterium]|nr:NAD(P)-dependent oxidoreductase [Candidatus Kapabacteria bacterium]